MKYKGCLLLKSTNLSRKKQSNRHRVPSDIYCKPPRNRTLWFHHEYRRFSVDLLTDKKMRQEYEKINILIVEDDFNHYLLIVEYLTSFGFTLLRATNDVEAWSILIKNDIHLILMDVKLNQCKINGIELSREIKAFFPLLPIIIQTAFIERINGIDLMKQVYDDYITKPYEIGHFRNKILYNLKFKSIITDN